jgi:hypothetical protein
LDLTKENACEKAKTDAKVRAALFGSEAELTDSQCEVVEKPYQEKLDDADKLKYKECHDKNKDSLE